MRTVRVNLRNLCINSRCLHCIHKSRRGEEEGFLVSRWGDRPDWWIDLWVNEYRIELQLQGGLIIYRIQIRFQLHFTNHFFWKLQMGILWINSWKKKMKFTTLFEHSIDLAISNSINSFWNLNQIHGGGSIVCGRRINKQNKCISMLIVDCKWICGAIDWVMYSCWTTADDDRFIITCAPEIGWVDWCVDLDKSRKGGGQPGQGREMPVERSVIM